MTTITQLNKEFDEFMKEEYGKWKIGRAEAKSFYNKKLLQIIDEMIKIVDENWDYPITSMKQLFHLRGVHPEIIEQEKRNDLVKEIAKELIHYKKKLIL